MARIHHRSRQLLALGAITLGGWACDQILGEDFGNKVQVGTGGEAGDEPGTGGTRETNGGGQSSGPPSGGSGGRSLGSSGAPQAPLGGTGPLLGGAGGAGRQGGISAGGSLRNSGNGNGGAGAGAPGQPATGLAASLTVLVEDGSGQKCSGILLANRWILLPAHCVPPVHESPEWTDPVEYDPVTRGLALTLVGTGEQRRASSSEVVQVVRHPSLLATWPRAGGVDATLLHVTTPFFINGSTSSLNDAPTTIRSGSAAALVGSQAVLQTLLLQKHALSRVDVVRLASLTDGFPGHRTTFDFAPDAKSAALAEQSAPGSLFSGNELIGLFTERTGGMVSATSHESIRGWTVATLLGGTGMQRGFCQEPTQHLYIGDLNADHRADLVCHGIDGRIQIRLARSTVDGQVPIPRWTGTGTRTSAGGAGGASSGTGPDPGLFETSGYENSLTPTTTWCSGLTGRFFLGDFNGDGRDDLMCLNWTSGTKWLAMTDAFGNPDIELSRNWVDGTAWCYSDDIMSIADFNGDGRGDLLCHSPGLGWDYIAYTDSLGHPDFSGGWANYADWCGGSDYQMQAGDTNGDRRADLICRNVVDGTVRIRPTDSTGIPDLDPTHEWVGTPGFCGGANTELRVADMNGDGRADLFCTTRATGAVKIAYSSAKGHPDIDRAWSGNLQWCNEQGDELFLADFNNDQSRDILCHNPQRAGSALWASQFVVFAKSGGVFRVE